MKLNKQTLKRIIKEELDSMLNEASFSPTEIYMKFQRQGGRDYWLSKAHDGEEIKYSDFMHAGQALRAYIDAQDDPTLIQMPDKVWNQIIKLIQDTI